MIAYIKCGRVVQMFEKATKWLQSDNAKIYIVHIHTHTPKKKKKKEIQLSNDERDR